MLVRVADHPSHPGQGSYFFRSPLGIATGDHNLAVGIGTSDAADCSSGVLIGSRGDSAGIQYDHVGFRSGVDSMQTSLRKLPLDGGAIRLRGTATKILHIEARHGEIISIQIGKTRQSPMQIGARSFRQMDYADAAGGAVLRCWKHSRQYTGRPCVGLNGTVVSRWQPEQTALVSTRW